MLSKKTVVILVIVALILALASFSYNSFNKNVSADNGAEGDSQGKVGIVILPPAVEDKGLNNNGVQNGP